jgi:predicted ester cyclase
MTTQNTNTEIVRRFIDDVWNAGHAERIATFTAPGFVDHAYQPANELGHRGMVERLKTIIPDATWSIDRLVAEGDDVVAELTLTGTHRGEFAGVAPKGNPLSVRCYRRFLLKNGKLREHDALLDTHQLLRQMAATPLP